MPEVTEYAPGTPSWADVSSPDLEAAKRFYGELFGWTAEAQPDPAAGGYTLLRRDGKEVAGLGPAQPGQPTAWTTYVSVADADATARRAREAGGTVLLEPMDVMDAGRMAMVADPTGAVFAIWQPGLHIGAALVNEPGSLCWNELQTRDPARAQTFYEHTFGWTGEAFEGPMSYTNFKLGDHEVAGMMEMGADFPDEVPCHWAVYIAVADCEATVKRAQELGGSVLVAPTKSPPGTFALLADPHGATFHVLEFAN